MTLVLHKLLPLIVSPLGLVSLLLLISILIRRRGPAVVGLLLLLVSAIPLTADRLWEALEAGYPYRSIESVDSADAVVVLSGMLGGIETSDGVVPQWGEATDRFFAGVDLLKAGKAPLIVFTRGQYPWDSLPPEGEQLAKRAIAMGVQDTQILLTGIVTNTADEANEVKTLMEFGGMRRVILVTSSFRFLAPAGSGGRRLFTCAVRSRDGGVGCTRERAGRPWFFWDRSSPCRPSVARGQASSVTTFWLRPLL